MMEVVDVHRYPIGGDNKAILPDSCFFSPSSMFVSQKMGGKYFLCLFSSS